MGETPAGVSGIIAGLELYGLSKVLNSAIEGVCLKMRHPSSQIRRDIIGIGLNCLGVNRDGTVNLLIEFVYHWLITPKQRPKTFVAPMAEELFTTVSLRSWIEVCCSTAFCSPAAIH